MFQYISCYLIVFYLRIYVVGSQELDKTIVFFFFMFQHILCNFVQFF